MRVSHIWVVAQVSTLSVIQRGGDVWPASRQEEAKSGEGHDSAWSRLHQSQFYNVQVLADTTNRRRHIFNRNDDDNEIYFCVWYSQISCIFSQQIAIIILTIQYWTGPSFIAFLFKTFVIIKYFKLGKELQLLHCGTIQESLKLTISSQLRKCMKWLHCSGLIWLPTLAIIWILETLF